MSPGFIQRVISLTGYNWVILSQKPRKERPLRSSLIPSEVHQHFQHNKDILSKLLSTLSKVPLSPHRVSPPSMVARVLFSLQNLPFAKFIPQRSHLLLPVFLQLLPPAEAKAYPSISAQDMTSQHPSRIYFPRQKTHT